MTREAMVASLKPALTSHLRSLGFKGSFPHFRHLGSDHVRLLSLQFHSSGGSFVVEIADCDPSGVLRADGTVRKEATKATVIDVGRPRARLGSPTFPTGDHWFDFGPRSYEVAAAEQPHCDFASITAAVIALVETQALPWWDELRERRRAGENPALSLT